MGSCNYTYRCKLCLEQVTRLLLRVHSSNQLLYSLFSDLKEEGLFRKSGHIGRQRLLREKLDAGENLCVELERDVYSAHDVASLLKIFLGELPEPLLSEKHYSAHLQVPGEYIISVIISTPNPPTTLQRTSTRPGECLISECRK